MRSHRDKAIVPSSKGTPSQKGRKLRDSNPVEEIAKDTFAASEARLWQVREQAREIQDIAARRAVESPMFALGVAFFFGAVLGAALTRRRH